MFQLETPDLIFTVVNADKLFNTNMRKATNSMLFNRILTSLVLFAVSLGCGKKDEDKVNSDPGFSSSSSRYLYVSTGLCYSGNGFTTFTAATASNGIYRHYLHGPRADGGDMIADFYAPPAATGDTPVSISDFSASHFLVLIENAAGRRVEKVAKNLAGERSVFTPNLGVATGTAKKIKVSTDGSVFISRSVAIEKYTSSAVRVFSSASNPWVNAPGGSCATSVMNITSVAPLTNNVLVYTHALSAQNRIGVISATGYVTTANCLASQTTPAAGAAYPTALVYLASSNQLLVAYGSSTNAVDLNSIYAYDINITTGAISGATKLIDGSVTNYVFGISAMAYDSETNHLYVGTANGTSAVVNNYNIEKFTYDSATKTLTRVGTSPFAQSHNDSKCISDMMISN